MLLTSYEAWVITDVDETTNEGYGAKRGIFSMWDKFFTFETKNSAEKMLEELKMYGMFTKDSRVEKIEIIGNI